MGILFNLAIALLVVTVAAFIGVIAFKIAKELTSKKDQ